MYKPNMIYQSIIRLKINQEIYVTIWGCLATRY